VQYYDLLHNYPCRNGYTRVETAIFNKYRVSSGKEILKKFAKRAKSGKSERKLDKFQWEKLKSKPSPLKVGVKID
jgi:hypothetical protein